MRFGGFQDCRFFSRGEDLIYQVVGKRGMSTMSSFRQQQVLDVLIDSKKEGVQRLVKKGRCYHAKCWNLHIERFTATDQFHRIVPHHLADPGF